MGFYLWLDGDLAWAQGTYEYRPMGAAVISASDLFRRRDFSARRQGPSQAEYVGQFASIGHLNQELVTRRGIPLDAETRRSRRKRGERHR
jgi:hypothetical protein